MRIAKPRRKKKQDPLVELALKMFKGTVLAEFPAAGRFGSKAKRASSRASSMPESGVDEEIPKADQLDLGI